MVGRVPEKQHSHDGTGKRDTRNICLGRGSRIRFWVDGLEHGVDRPDDLAMVLAISCLFQQNVSVSMMLWAGELSRWEVVSLVGSERTLFR